MTIRIRPLLAAVILSTGVAGVVLQSTAASAQSTEGSVLSRDSVLRDPDTPVAGNPKGDVTVVEYFDYQCPYCKKVNPELAQIVREDGHIRLVLKDWPIFGGVSVHAARLALAAKFQDKYREAHDALMQAKEKLTEANVQTVLAQTGIDVERADRDLAANQKVIDAILARNHEQAVALGFRGTPAFIIGTYRVPGVLDVPTFKQAIADARAAQRNKR